MLIIWNMYIFSLIKGMLGCLHGRNEDSMYSRIVLLQNYVRVIK